MWDKDSLSSVIDYSDVFKGYFADLTKKVHEGDLEGVGVRNLGMARHRFESTQKPLSRLVLWCDAAIGTALYIIRVRRSGSREHKIAKHFLQFLNVERLVQAAMMCDGGDESLQLLRFCANPAMDMATALGEIASFMARIDFLFLQGGCLNTEGYTQRVIDSLRRRAITFQVGGVWKSIGGPLEVGDEVVQRCLARMGCWVRVAKSVVSAEFPAFELLQSFSVFTAAAKVSTGMCPAAFVMENQRHFKRLARVFNVDADELAAQFVEHVFIAREIMMSSPGVSLREAWKDAILRTQSSRAATRRPANALLPVVMRYLVYVASTTAIEHSFSKRLRTVKPQQLSWSDSTESDLIKVLLDYEAAKDATTISLAQKVWAESFSATRMWKTPRLTKGVPSTAVKASEAAFQRKRRVATRRGVHGGPQAQGVYGGGPQGVESQWCDSLQAEIDFQAHKLKKRKIEAYQDGLLLEDEADEHLRREAEQATANDHKAARDRHVAERRQDRRQATPLPATWFAGKSVFIEDCNEEAQKEIYGLGMTITRERRNADVMLVTDPTSMSKRSTWAAILKGIHVSTVSGLRGRGPAIKYEPALASKRHVWLSPSFRAKHPTLVDMMGVFMQGDQDFKVKWRIKGLVDVAEFVDKVKRDKDLIGLVLSREKEEPPPTPLDPPWTPP